MSKRLAFDIETANPAPGESVDASYDLGVTCAALCINGDDSDVWYGELSKPMTPAEVQDFCTELASYHSAGYRMVGINSTSFDWRVLAESAQDKLTYRCCQELALDSFDPPLQLFCERGFIKGMDAIAKGFMLDAQKGELGGLEAIEAWKDGRADQVLEYAKQDALVTYQIAVACAEQHGIAWEKDGRVIKHSWKRGRLLTVREMLRLPLPDVTWMKERGMKPWSRDRFTGWLSND